MKIAELVLKYVEALVWPLVTVALVWGLRAHVKDAFRRLTRLETPAGSMEFAEEARELLDEAERLTLPRPHRPSEDRTPAYPVPDPMPVPLPAPVPGSDEPSPPPPFMTPGGPAGPAQPQPDPEPSMRRWVYADENDHAPEPPPNPWAGEDGEENRSFRMRSRRPRRLQGGVLPRELFAEAMTMASASPVGAVITAWTTLEGLCVDILRQRRIPVARSGSGAHNGRQLTNGLSALGISEGSEDVFFQLRLLRNTAVHQPDSVTPEAARDFVHSCRSVASELQQYDRALDPGAPNRGSRTPPGDVGGRA